MRLHETVLILKFLFSTKLSDYFKNLPPAASTMDPTGNGGNVISSNTVNSGNTYNSTGFAINNSGAFDLKDMLSKQVNPNPVATGGLF